MTRASARRRTVTVEAEERRRVLRRFSDRPAVTYRFRAEPPDGSSRVSGIEEVKGFRWVFPTPPVSQPLEVVDVAEKGAWDTFFSVTVVPDRTLAISFEDATVRSGGPWRLTVVIVVLAAATMLS